MSCFHPLIGIDTGEKTASGKVKYFIRKREDSADFQKEIDLNPHILLPCGHCIGCRIDYSRAWADRMMLELQTSKKAIFVTLTYDNEHAPWSQFDENGYPLYASLNKRDCQLFMKRLRERFDCKIRFFLAGEYGPSTLRPHYHAIIFGLGIDDFHDLKSHGTNELGQCYYISDCLSSIWCNGFVLLSDVSWKTCAYVARYVTKKLNGPASIEYAERNVISEFSLMSRKPGIGKKYLDLHPECLDYENINISTADSGLKIRIPKYYYRQLQLTDPERYDKIMSERKQFAEDSMILQLQKTGLSFLDYLEVKEEKKRAQLKTLKRGAV